AIFLSMLFSYYLLKMGQMTLMPFWRYLIFVLFFTLPILFYYFSEKVSLPALFLLFSATYVLNTSSETNNIYNSYNPPPEGFFKSAEYVKNNLSNFDNPKFILSVDPYNGDDFWKIKSGIYNDYLTFGR